MNLPKPRAVIFDWDDTIVDSWDTITEAINTTLVAMGHKAWSDDEARRNIGPSAKDLFRQLFGDRWQEADKVYYDTVNKIFLKNIRIHANAEDVLKALAAHKVYMAVVSNKRGHLLRTEAAHIKFDRYFGRLVGAGDASADKPHPAPVHLALQDSGVTAGEDVWFVGDSHTDMLCAVNAGCAPILLETKPPPEEMLLKNPPLRRFKKHSDLMEFIRTNFVGL